MSVKSLLKNISPFNNKAPVDKPVYNVENYEFSTDILPRSFPQPVDARLYIPVDRGGWLKGIMGLRQPERNAKPAGKRDGWFQFVGQLPRGRRGKSRGREKNLCKTAKADWFHFLHPR